MDPWPRPHYCSLSERVIFLQTRPQKALYLPLANSLVPLYKVLDETQTAAGSSPARNAGGLRSWIATCFLCPIRVFGHAQVNSGECAGNITMFDSGWQTGCGFRPYITGRDG